MSAKNLGGVSLKEKEIRELLKLEELFHSHYLTEELINGMVNLYVKFTQNILHNQQSIRLYFMEKIKFVLSRSEVIRILEKKNNSENKNMRQGTKVGGQVNEEEEMQMKKIAEQAKEEIRRNHNLNGKKQRVYVNTAKGEQLREKQRNMQIEMQIQIMEEVQQNMMLMKKELNDSEGWKKKEKEINRIAQNQDNALQERLAKRKKKLRKKSAELKEKEVMEIQAAPPIEKKQLLAMKKELNQTYERFTRLTMSKTKRATQLGRQNEGRVKVNVKQIPIQEEDIFDVVDKEKNNKAQQKINFSKKKAPQTLSPSESAHHKNVQKHQKQNIQKAKEQPVPRQADSTIEYKAFDQNKGRVTVRQKNYEQIQDEQLY